MEKGINPEIQGRRIFFIPCSCGYLSPSSFPDILPPACRTGHTVRTPISPGDIPEKNGVGIDIMLVDLPLMRKELSFPFQEFIVFLGLPEKSAITFRLLSGLFPEPF
jgi:hypothetical protein